MDDGSPELTPWTVVRSRTIVEDRWITLCAETCVTAEGVEISPYYVIDHGDWVAVIAIDENDDVVMVEQYRHGIRAVSLGLPSGGIERSDHDPIAAAQRELLEETGYIANDWTYITKLANNPPNARNWCHIIIATGAKRIATPLGSPTELMHTRTMPITMLKQIACSGLLPHAVEVAALTIGLTVIGRW